MSKRRVKFYSECDMTVGQYLKTIESYLDNWEEDNESRIVDDVLELYNIKRYFDAGLHLEDWDEERLDVYRAKVKRIPSIIGKFCATKSNDNFIETYRDISREYKGDFWEVLSKLEAI